MTTAEQWAALLIGFYLGDEPLTEEALQTKKKQMYDEADRIISDSSGEERWLQFPDGSLLDIPELKAVQWEDVMEDTGGESGIN